MLRASSAIVVTAAALCCSAAFAAPAPPLIGANYSHFGLAGCDFGGYGVVPYGGSPFAQATIREQLAAMRSSGLDSLRLFLWHLHDASGQSWGVVSSAGGTLGPVDRQNLVRYLGFVRDAGFKQLTVVFGPEWTNDPIGFMDNRWDPSLFEENWQFIRTVRPLVKQYGPASTHFDLINEGAPSDYLATKQQLAAYIAHMYSNYVDEFGNADVTVSSIVAWNDQSRIGNLIDTLRSTGRPLPTWFEIHAGGATLLQDLQATDATLTAKGLSQPLSIGETSYDDPQGAEAIKTFVATSSRPLVEVMEWPLRLGSGCSAISVAPPYRADSYVTALTGSPPATTLTAEVGTTFALTSPYGRPLTALTPRTYTLTVTDRSKRESFHLIGPGVNRSTGVAGRGTATWQLDLRPGTYAYRSDRKGSKLRGSFVVLAPG